MGFVVINRVAAGILRLKVKCPKLYIIDRKCHGSYWSNMIYISSCEVFNFVSHVA